MEDTTPALIVMDLKMPEMDGFALIHAIRARDEWKSLPIVVVSAMDISLEDGQRLRRQVQRVIQKGTVNNEDLMVEIRYVAAAAARQLEEAA
jgi:CheY-like chemotaxis protein